MEEYIGGNTRYPTLVSHIIIFTQSCSSHSVCHKIIKFHSNILDKRYTTTESQIWVEDSLIKGKLPIHPMPAEVYSVQDEHSDNKRGKTSYQMGETKPINQEIILWTNHKVHYILLQTGVGD